MLYLKDYIAEPSINSLLKLMLVSAGENGVVNGEWPEKC